ncbi:MAG TPA: hypothetical protein VFM31_00640 [Nitrososphaeraceae archaeon]|jgi:hypothetical protein|nr:hypothetical protein [Nitrososphaeraceae archaeon]
MSCESLIVGTIAGLTLISTALVFQFFNNRKKEFKNLTAGLSINK